MHRTREAGDGDFERYHSNRQAPPCASRTSTICINLTRVRRLTRGYAPPSHRDWREEIMSVKAESDPRELKPEQRLAAHTLDRHVSVTAGPGAGKTTVLVERYLHILRTHDISVDQIVAITFTNRAANEMRERLRAELGELLRDAAPKDRAKWMRHKRTLEGAIITTIHGFCARLLREFPVEADIDPQFILLDAHQSAMLEEAVVEEALTEFISAGHRPITELAAGAARARLARGLIDIYRSMRNQGLTTERLQVLAEKNHATIEDYRREVDELSRMMDEFIHTRGLTASVEEKRLETSRRWPALREILLNELESISIGILTEAVQTFREKTKPTAHGKSRDLIKRLDELIWKDRLGGKVPQMFFDLHAERYARELIHVVKALERRLDDEKRRRAALDFDDLQVRAFRLLDEHPEVLRRTSGRYKFFLVDEFQDTNTLQRDLMMKLALGKERRSNLFIVGDRKQSIYGFRGADVDVFREMSSEIQSQNGLPVTLNRNFRSQAHLINCFNFLFESVFVSDAETTPRELNELGYVEHEPSLAAREDADLPPVVELLIDARKSDKRKHQDEPSSDPYAELKPRERDAEQLAARIISLVGKEPITTRSSSRKIQFRDIAILFRAMTEVHLYEGALRRAGIPYITVNGKGFYVREEIRDFIQLLRFLDNKTDEVALAAVLRSPICGLSDDALLALRCPQQPAGELRLETVSNHREPQDAGAVRPLLEALYKHETIDSIGASERPALDRARDLLSQMITRAKRSRVSELLRFAVEASEYRIVTAANFDGAQRLANIEKLFTLAERFESSGAYMIRDFVRFVRDFEEAGGRESEGQIDDTADAVRLMSIHQSKGLEFPVVVIPDLHRLPDNRREWWSLDRHRGLTLKVPNGAGALSAGHTYTTFTERAKRREEFESMRLLYVAATRAQDRLILSGAVRDTVSDRSWLGWICKALTIAKDPVGGTLNPADGVVVRLTLNVLDDGRESPAEIDITQTADKEPAPPSDQVFRLLNPIEPQRTSGFQRFSVTQLLNYQRCPRQYYFDRVLHAPSEEEIAVWNDADAPEPPANLTATLRGAVIHRFCEKYAEGDDVGDLLRRSFEEVLSQRAAELAERVMEIDRERAINDMLPLAQNYVGSSIRKRIESARALAQHSAPSTQHSPLGVLNEQRFRIRRPLGLLSGTIDKLIAVSDSNGLSVEIIDFKTNRFRLKKPDTGGRTVKGGSPSSKQLSLDFFAVEPREADPDLLVQAAAEAAAIDYQIQMQAYALAARALIPEVADLKVTLHFLHPNIEVSLKDDLLEREACETAIDETVVKIVSSSSPEAFPPEPAEHCRACNFVELCQAGTNWLWRT